MSLKTWKQIEYCEVGKGAKTALLFHGGHMRATSDSCEAFFVENDFRVLIPSRPGYGKTPLEAGKSTADFADAMAEFVQDLHLKKVLVIGISAGGPAALQFAQRHPELTEALILQSSIGHDGWPDKKTSWAAHIAFNHITERYTWALMRLNFRLFPLATLKLMLGSLSAKKTDKALQTIQSERRTAMIEVLKQSRSGRGFVNDLHYQVGSIEHISAPTLIIHSKYDASVDMSHPQYLAKHIPHARLFMSEAENHMFWFSDYYPKIETEMKRFLDTSR